MKGYKERRLILIYLNSSEFSSDDSFNRYPKLKSYILTVKNFKVSRLKLIVSELIAKGYIEKYIDVNEQGSTIVFENEQIRISNYGRKYAESRRNYFSQFMFWVNTSDKVWTIIPTILAFMLGLNFHPIIQFFFKWFTAIKNRLNP